MKTADEIIFEQYGVSENSANNTPMDKGECINCMIEFAKLHVQEALKKASENANIRMVTLGQEDCASVTKSVYHSESATDFKIEKQSILNSYPLENIK